MTAWPRLTGALPRIATPPEFTPSSLAWSQMGRSQTRGAQQLGRTWQETYAVLDSANHNVRVFLENLNRSLREGLLWDVQHPYLNLRKGVGGGSPVIHCPANTIVEPENMAGASWFELATPVTLYGGQTDPFGGTGAWLFNDDDATNQAEGRGCLLNFTGDGEKAVAFFTKAGNSGGIHFGIWDLTAAAWRMQIRATFTNGVPGSFVVVSGTGLAAQVEDWGGGWYRIAFTGTGCVAANANQLRLRSTPAVNGSEVGSAYFFGANAWNSTLPGPYRGPSNPGPFGLPLTQEGSLLYVRGAPVSTTAWLRQGDLLSIPGIPVVLDVTAQVDTNANGGARIPIHPPLHSGVRLADAVALTTDASVIFFSAIIVAADLPVIDTTRYLDPGLTITWQEQPA